MLKKAENSKYQRMRSSLRGSLDMRGTKIEFPEIEEKQKKVFYVRGFFKNIYEELNVLGSGCSGVVRRVKKVSTGEYFASKKVKIKSEETISLAIREFKSMKKLNHENIVKIYELYIDESQNSLYTIMELIEAKEMRHVIKDLGCYSEDVAQIIFKQILNAIRYLHENKICHRDLKPSNILADEIGECIKITDFNVSKFGENPNQEQDSPFPEKQNGRNMFLKMGKEREKQEEKNERKSIFKSIAEKEKSLENSGTEEFFNQTDAYNCKQVQQTNNDIEISPQISYHEKTQEPINSEDQQQVNSQQKIKDNNFTGEKEDDTQDQKISQGIQQRRRLSNRWKRVKMWTYTGTVSFCAPEMLGDAEYDESVDVWSAGVVLYTMLSGEEPFMSEYLNDLISKINKADYSLEGSIWRNVSEEAKDLIKKCLILNPQERIKPEQALLHPWITKKENTSPLALMIFSNFENESRRFSKQLDAYQQLGIIGRIHRTQSIDLSILPSMNQTQYDKEERQEGQEKKGFLLKLRQINSQVQQCQTNLIRHYSLQQEDRKKKKLSIDQSSLESSSSSESDSESQSEGQDLESKELISLEKIQKEHIGQAESYNKEETNQRDQFERKTKFFKNISPSLQNLCNQTSSEGENSNENLRKIRSVGKRQHKTVIIHDRYHISESDKLIIYYNEREFKQGKIKTSFFKIPKQAANKEQDFNEKQNNMLSLHPCSQPQSIKIIKCEPAQNTDSTSSPQKSECSDHDNLFQDLLQIYS